MNDRVFSEYLVLYLTNLKESSQDGFGLIIIKKGLQSRLHIKLFSISFILILSNNIFDIIQT